MESPAACQNEPILRPALLSNSLASQITKSAEKLGTKLQRNRAAHGSLRKQFAEDRPLFGSRMEDVHGANDAVRTNLSKSLSSADSFLSISGTRLRTNRHAH